MPGHNTVTIGGGTPVLFPLDGPTNNIITRINEGQFNLLNIEVYEVNFQISTDTPGQFVIVLNDIELDYTVVGRATGTCQIVGISLVQTYIINSILSINNPIGKITSISITPFAGGTRPVSAHLIIKQIV